MLLDSPNTGKYGPEKSPYLDTFHAVYFLIFWSEKATETVTVRNTGVVEFIHTSK